MKVELKNGGEVIWARDSNSLEGIASLGHLKDGTQQKIITALEEALSQAKGELLCSDDADSVANISTSAA